MTILLTFVSLLKADDLAVQYRETMSAGKQHCDTSEELSSLSDGECPLEKARRRGDKHHKGRSKGEQQAKEDAMKKDIKWLCGQALAHPRYNEFCANCNRKLTNLEHVKLWAFTASFSAEHYGNFLEAQVHSFTSSSALSCVNKSLSTRDRQTEGSRKNQCWLHWALEQWPSQRQSRQQSSSTPSAKVLSTCRKWLIPWRGTKQKGQVHCLSFFWSGKKSIQPPEYTRMMLQFQVCILIGLIKSFVILRLNYG